ncbi:MAG: FAD-dependent oxidoreductase [bacterium]|nr:FAD-dependent oxidoreductase [bacterium]
MPDSLKIEADIVIIGGGFMGLALARQAALKGLCSVIVEQNQVQTAHYMSGLLAPRADYLRFDKEEVEFTAHECRRWLDMFPDIVCPKLFIMPLNSESPYSHSFLKPLMELYDKTTPARLGNFYQPHFRINNMVLEQMEPNLRKSYFDEGLGFYELTVEPNKLLHRLQRELASISNFRFLTCPDRVKYHIQGERIVAIESIFDDNSSSFSLENSRGLIVVNCSGPWMQDMAIPLGLNLPIEYRLGFQLSVKEKYLFQHSIITFGSDKKYVIISQQKDYVQVGPTNTDAESPEDINNLVLRGQATDYLVGILKDTIEPGYNLTEPKIRSGGLRVQLKLPLAPDSNRPFILNTRFENYYVVYPGKAVLALRTADEFLDKVIDKKELTLCLGGGHKIKNSIKLNFIRLRSLAMLGLWYCRTYLLGLFQN